MTGIAAGLAMFCVALLAGRMLAARRRRAARAVPWPLSALHRARIRRRASMFERQLSVALPMLSSSLRAGAALNTALRHLAENGEAPLSQELGLLLREQRLGIPWDEALARLEQRVPSEATALTAAALRIATRSGGNLAEALDRIADTLRARSQLQARLRALTSQGRMQAWIVGALPVLLLAVLYLLEPAIMNLLWRTPAGWGVLALLAALETAGVVLIRRIAGSMHEAPLRAPRQTCRLMSQRPSQRVARAG